MRLTSSEATEILNLLDANDADGVRDLIKPFVFVNHESKAGDRVQLRSHKVTAWSDEQEVLNVVSDSEGNEVLVLSFTRPDGSKGVTQRYVKDVQVRLAQPRRARKSEQGKGKSEGESNGEAPEGEPERVVPTKAKAS